MGRLSPCSSRLPEACRTWAVLPLRRTFERILCGESRLHAGYGRDKPGPTRLFSAPDGVLGNVVS